MHAGEEIALEYNQPAQPVPGQPDTEPILRVASIMQVRPAALSVLAACKCLSMVCKYACLAGVRSRLR